MEVPYISLSGNIFEKIRFVKGEILDTRKEEKISFFISCGGYIELFLLCV